MDVSARGLWVQSQKLLPDGPVAGLYQLLLEDSILLIMANV